MLRSFILFGAFLTASMVAPVSAQQMAEEAEPLPKVFLIGEHEDRYGALYEEYHEILLAVCKNDMTVAFDRWMHMVTEMEEYAKTIDFDLNGVKVWLKLFWNNTGAIDHLSYYLKPDSRNIEVAELSAFFSSFMNHYTLPVESTVKFTHNGSAQFPIGVMPPTARR